MRLTKVCIQQGKSHNVSGQIAYGRYPNYYLKDCREKADDNVAFP